MAEEPKGDGGKGKGKSPQDKEIADNKTVSDSSKVVPTQQQKQDVDPKQIDAMLKMLGLSNNTITTQTKTRDMDSHKFWQTQPVQSFDEAKKKVSVEEEGPLKQVDKNKVPKQPAPLGHPKFTWVTMDLTKADETKEVYDLLSDNYVEDNEAMFRFNYSETFLNWALKAPGWQKEWHVGVRVLKDDGTPGKLSAFVSGIPIDLRVRDNTFRSAEVNYLCVHKKLRNKRLTPQLIQEITRRFNVEGIYQAIYTAGIVIPSPLSTCRYYHRTLDFDKLYEVGFSPLPPGTTRQRHALRYKLPAKPSISGIRPMEEKDISQVLDLLERYLARFSIAQKFTEDEMKHWFIHPEGLAKGQERVIWTYVVESEGKITDFFSFYRLESTVIKRNKVIKAAYLYYYGTEHAFQKNKSALKTRLNDLMKDLLILAKKESFDVVNALTLLDNPLFLEEQKFGPGDGQLHYYLYNYRASPIPGGVDVKNKLDTSKMGGVGMVML